VSTIAHFASVKVDRIYQAIPQLLSFFFGLGVNLKMIAYQEDFKAIFHRVDTADWTNSGNMLHSYGDS
jgi:hypothetical protein